MLPLFQSCVSQMIFGEIINALENHVLFSWIMLYHISNAVLIYLVGLLNPAVLATLLLSSQIVIHKIT